MGATYKRYSVYLREDDTPVIIFATAEECAAAIGCTVGTFYCYLSRQKKRLMYPKKYAIYEDEVSAEDRKLFSEERKLFPKDRKPKLKDADLRIIALMLKGLSQTAVGIRLGVTPNTVHYHCEKILRATGLDPRCFPELVQLGEQLMIPPADISSEVSDG